MAVKTVRSRGFSLTLVRGGKTLAMGGAVAGIAMPFMAESILGMAMGNTAYGWISLYSTTAAAAMGVSDGVLGVVLASLTALSSGCSILAAQAFGAGRRRDARSLTVFTALIAGAWSLIIASLCQFFAPSLISLVAGDAAAGIAATAVILLRYSAWALPFLSVEIVLSASMRASGDAKTPMMISFIGDSVMLAIYALLLRSAPDGLAVIGLAMIVSRAVSAGCSLAAYVHKNRGLGGGVQLIEQAPGLARITAPILLEQMVLRLGSLAATRMIITLGASAMVAWNLAGNLAGMMLVPVFGISIAGSTLVGQSVGGRDGARALAVGRGVRRWGVLAPLVPCVLIAIMAPHIIGMMSRDAEVIALAVVIVRLAVFTAPVTALATVTAGILRGAGDVRFLTRVNMICMWGVRIALGGGFIALGFGLPGLALSVFLDAAIRAIVFSARFRKRSWQGCAEDGKGSRRIREGGEPA